MQKTLNFSGLAAGAVCVILALLAGSAQGNSVPTRISGRVVPPVDQVANRQLLVRETRATVAAPTRVTLLSVLRLSNPPGEEPQPVPIPKYSYMPVPIVSSSTLAMPEIQPVKPPSEEAVGVPDGGATWAMLGLALGGLILWRKMQAQGAG